MWSLLLLVSCRNFIRHVLALVMVINDLLYTYFVKVPFGVFVVYRVQRLKLDLQQCGSDGSLPSYSSREVERCCVCVLCMFHLTV